MPLFEHLGSYIITMKGMFARPENEKMYWKEFMHQCVEIGIGSLPIVLIISMFLGMVMTVQTAYQLVANFIPLSTIAVVVRDSMLLELSPTVICVVLAGVVGSKIASELGNMRISEQIDALEIMGINTKTYLILPKVLASLIVVPMLITLSIVISLWGGRFVGEAAGIINSTIFDEGLLRDFNPFNVTVAMVKAVTFALLISSISAYFGYNVKGGALEIGRSSTLAVVVSCILILLADYVITLILLNP
ncbi:MULTISPECIES: MlaE family ABC transporter permease [Phnomibacter]|jgi:phospholipid/cholesterol/gamma-HCH transport system permease protein|uniref:ABC transporter permease n=1 Tax=Phnomibacter ginsenosidimutans TaxID=2676868 RepID=A0A6I6GD96_9BACT|nr:ABC transporter permease [Phnomibacter ginsenosidimutans]MCA0381538.1 ABC transporter permease [Bacteroidota bacterium]QGW28280.1 ABC transporter permease [Phnomibacter ginsenosidimutans]